ncbi:phage major capsid protein [Terricaulis sp.]|uniref:phage major capsid protein n=1 Tax=Terricaulis sp. TaxID=2768686 RepID=UPI002AC3A7E7|nr:phage major capsid protein [Terricaulis sp.]MDZ4691300.1 phage major capsid protein [Terricaulis sp.]
MKLHELKEARAKKVAELRTINDAANGNELPAEQRSRFDAVETEVRALNDQIGRAERLAEFERTAATGTPINDNGTPDFERECRAFSLTRALAYASGLTVDAAREVEVSQEIERRSGRKPQGALLAPAQIFLVPRHPNDIEHRVMVSGTTGAGLVGTEHRPQDYIDALRANLVTGRLGATTLSNLQQNVSIPKNAANRSGQWIAENAALTPVDGDFDSVTMTPKHVGALTEFSRNMLLQSSPDIETLIRNDFAAALAVALDKAALVGGGSNEPSGIIDRLTDASAMGTLADASWEQVLAFIAGVELANAATGRLGWALNPNAVKTMRAKPKVVYGSPETRDAGAGFVMDGPNELAGYAAASTTSMPGSGSPAAGSAIFGDFASLLIGYWSGIDILANPYESTAYAKGNVQVRGLLTADVAVRHLESFQAATDIPA